MARAGAGAFLFLIACGSCEQPADLADYLRSDPDVASWRLDRDAWQRVVVPSYAPLYDDYVRALDAAAPRWAAQLATHGAITIRAHFAGDPALTRDQACIRWALPTLYPAQVATVDGAPLDAVFVRVDNRWRAITGIDTALRARVPCPDLFGRASPTKPCRDALWSVADAALRAADTSHACDLARTLCGANP